MMEDYENKIHISGDVVQLSQEPFSLRARRLRQRAVQREQQGVGNTDRIVTAVLQVGKALEVVGERNSLIAVEIVVSQRRIYRDAVSAPHGSLAIPYIPVVSVITVVDDISAETDKRRVQVRNRLHQCLANRRIRGFGVVGIVKTGISIRDEAKRRVDVEIQFNRRGRQRNLRIGTGAGAA